MAGTDQDLTDVYNQNVRSLRPLRVLLDARDRRFARVTSFLLARRGYEVTQSDPGSLLADAADSRADVVVLQTDSSRGASARLVAALERLASSPGIVSVSGAAQADWLGVPSVEKWSSVDELVSEIEAAAQRRPGPATNSSQSGL